MEAEKLQSRLEQQSNLICMLKQRNDKSLKELSETTSRYEGGKEHLASVQQSLAEETQRRKLVEHRFHQLARNHEQMIDLKDEYKEEARRLKEKEVREKKKVGEEKSAGIEEEQVKKMEKEWKEKVRAMEGRLMIAEEERSTLERRVKELEDEIKRIINKHLNSIQQLQENLRVAEKDGAAVRDECTEKEKTLTQLKIQLGQVEHSLQFTTSKLQLTTEKVATIEEELAVMKDREMKRDDKLERDSAILSLRRQLDRSQQNLLSVQKEYAAYRTHSAELLAHERKLNLQLRHLLE